MIYFLLLPLALILLGLFVLLTWIEGKAGRRLFGASRARLDANVERAAFVLQHVDWGAFTNDVLRTGFERALHDLAHGTLMAVRFIERVLTRVVRYLRMRRQLALQAPDPSLPKESRISGTLSYLRRALRRTRRAPEHLPGQDDVVEL